MHGRATTTNWVRGRVAITERSNARTRFHAAIARPTAGEGAFPITVSTVDSARLDRCASSISRHEYLHRVSPERRKCRNVTFAVRPGIACTGSLRDSLAHNDEGPSASHPAITDGRGEDVTRSSGDRYRLVACTAVSPIG